MKADNEIFSDVWMKTPAETRAFNSFFVPKKEKNNDEFDYDAYNEAEELKRKRMLAKESDEISV